MRHAYLSKLDQRLTKRQLAKRSRKIATRKPYRDYNNVRGSQ
jgi:hypothetical protein